MSIITQERHQALTEAGWTEKEPGGNYALRFFKYDGTTEPVASAAYDWREGLWHMRGPLSLAMEFFAVQGIAWDAVQMVLRQLGTLRVRVPDAGARSTATESAQVAH